MELNLDQSIFSTWGPSGVYTIHGLIFIPKKKKKTQKAKTYNQCFNQRARIVKENRKWVNHDQSHHVRVVENVIQMFRRFIFFQQCSTALFLSTYANFPHQMQQYSTLAMGPCQVFNKESIDQNTQEKKKKNRRDKARIKRLMINIDSMEFYNFFHPFISEQKSCGGPLQDASMMKLSKE